MDNQIFYHPSGWMPALQVDDANPTVSAGDPSASGDAVIFDAQLASLATQTQESIGGGQASEPGEAMGYFPTNFPAWDAAAWQHYTMASQSSYYYPVPNGLPDTTHMQPQPLAPFYPMHMNVGWATADVATLQGAYMPTHPLPETTPNLGGQWASPFTAAAGASAHGGQLAASFGSLYPAQLADRQADHVAFAHDLNHEAADAPTPSFPSSPPPYTVAVPENALAAVAPKQAQLPRAAMTASRKKIKISKALCQKALALVRTVRGSGGGACPVGGCGAVLKTQIRRHIRSHGPAEKFCSVPGCRAIFVRWDVVKKHEREVHGLRRSTR
ncbi:hypothetical protein AURDEDRAFT_124113 [Auricularia subglabra TFB-10046 SS5]|nr:hypothetical protein AURDEDRAFT_124113 [Auricularia subglabra TFB-10046 SS5]